MSLHLWVEQSESRDSEPATSALAIPLLEARVKLNRVGQEGSHVLEEVKCDQNVIVGAVHHPVVLQEVGVKLAADLRTLERCGIEELKQLHLLEDGRL